MNIRKYIWAYVVAMALICPGVKAQEQITIGVIQYDVRDIDKSFKALHEQGFGSCELNYSEKRFTKELAEQVKAASEKHRIRVTTLVGVPGSKSTWNFRQGPATIGLVPIDERFEKLDLYRKMIDFCVQAGIPAMHSHFGFIPEDPSSAQYKDFIEVMRGLATYAKERNVLIYFETGQETPITLIRAIRDIGTGNLFINCDLANLLMYGKSNSLDAVKLFGNLIKEFHAKDGKYPDPNNPYELGHEVPIPGRVPISERPPEADGRSAFGHWEADSVIGVGCNLHTEVERRTRFLMARIVPDKTAGESVGAQLDMFSPLPAGARVSVTHDNGTEFAHHERLRDGLGMATYFADPYSSWQRGSNENRNGMIRRYLPKRCEIRMDMAKEVREIVDEINNRPMRVLGYRTPAEAFADELLELQDQQGCCTSK